MVPSKLRCRLSAVLNWRTSESTAAAMFGYWSLQASERPSFRDRAMDLAQRCRGRRFALEMFELLFPVRPEFRRHAAFDEARTHRRRIGLQRQQRCGHFRRQYARHRRHELRDLHHRPAKIAQNLREVCRILGAEDGCARQRTRRAARGHARKPRGDARETRQSLREPVFLFAHADRIKVSFSRPRASFFINHSP